MTKTDKITNTILGSFPCQDGMGFWLFNHQRNMITLIPADGNSGSFQRNPFHLDPYGFLTSLHVLISLRAPLFSCLPEVAADFCLSLIHHRQMSRRYGYDLDSRLVHERHSEWTVWGLTNDLDPCFRLSAVHCDWVLKMISYNAFLGYRRGYRKPGPGRQEVETWHRVITLVCTLLASVPVLARTSCATWASTSFSHVSNLHHVVSISQWNSPWRSFLVCVLRVVVVTAWNKPAGFLQSLCWVLHGGPRYTGQDIRTFSTRFLWTSPVRIKCTLLQSPPFLNRASISSGPVFVVASIVSWMAFVFVVSFHLLHSSYVNQHTFCCSSHFLIQYSP